MRSKILQFVFICGVLIGCKPPGKTSPIKISWVEATDNPKIVKYHIDNSDINAGISLDWFNDSIGKFNVGDTLYFENKNK
jgi:hypothetical protein